MLALNFLDNDKIAFYGFNLYTKGQQLQQI